MSHGEWKVKGWGMFSWTIWIRKDRREFSSVGISTWGRSHKIRQQFPIWWKFVVMLLSVLLMTPPPPIFFYNWSQWRKILFEDRTTLQVPKMMMEIMRFIQWGSGILGTFSPRCCTRCDWSSLPYQLTCYIALLKLFLMLHYFPKHWCFFFLSFNSSKRNLSFH